MADNGKMEHAKSTIIIAATLLTILSGFTGALVSQVTAREVILGRISSLERTVEILAGVAKDSEQRHSITAQQVAAHERALEDLNARIQAEQVIMLELLRTRR